ncbi:MAG: hypothetical protein ABFS16_01890 [Bacteroidota bacterium]
MARFGNDPNYVYLVNSTALCSGEGVGYIDHPGTPVMQVGAVSITVKHLFSNPNNQTLAEHVISDSHTFILSIRNTLLILNTLILLLIGWFAVIKTRSVWIALLLQASTLITLNSLDHIWTKVSPAPLLFFITGLLVIALLGFYFSRDNKSWKYVLIFALISGAGLGTKATYLPLTIIPFIILPGYKKKLIYLAGIIPAFVLFTIPIIPEYEQMYYWFRDLSSHSGIYGHGDKGFIDFQTYLPNIIKIIQNNIVFSAVIITGAILFLFTFIQSYRSKIKPKKDEYILGGLVAGSLLGILMVAKHYHSNHYLIPVLLLTGITVFFIHRVLIRKVNIKFITNYGIPVTTILLFVMLGVKLPQGIKYINDGYKGTNAEMETTNTLIDSLYSDYTQIYYYPNSLNQYSALNFGDVYTQRRMLPEIRKVHGDIYFYHSHEKTFKNWNKEIFTDDLINKKGNRLLLVGGPKNEKEAMEFRKQRFPLKQIYKGRIQAIYELDTTRYNQISKNKDVTVEETIYCDIEELTSDNKYYLCSDGSIIGNPGRWSDEKARSGKYSLKMDNKTEYALEYILTGLIPGDTYEVEIWRYSNNNSGRLVVASSDAKLFYKAQNETVKTDGNGWGLIRIKFEIPPKLENQSLKIYLWNTNKQTGYFDDFTITKLGEVPEDSSV